MKVQPNPSGQIQRPGVDRAGRPTRTPDRSSPSAPGLSFDAPAQDNVELSTEARALQPTAETSVPEGSIEPARFRQVLDRVASGFYEREDVREAVVDKLRQEL